MAAETTQEDLDRLAENLMSIVGTVKRMTQPEMIAVVNGALGALDTEHKPVGIWKLLRSMRDPAVQEGLGVMLELTRQVARHAPEGNGRSHEGA
jgi:uncharacterized protein YjgD (DUF1641 family)